MRIALLEDDPLLGPLFAHWLHAAGHTCRVFSAGQPFRREVARDSYDLLIVDRMLPDMSGDEVIVWVRDHLQWPVPVIIVSARHSEEDIVRGLELGADDYVVKPVRHSEFLARVAAVARRAPGGERAQEEASSCEPYHIDFTRRVVTLRGAPVELTTKEFDLAAYLFRHAGRPLSRTHILSAVWGREPGTSMRTVDTHVSRLRSKLAIRQENGWRLAGIYHYGYRLDDLRRDNAGGDAPDTPDACADSPRGLES